MWFCARKELIQEKKYYNLLIPTESSLSKLNFGNEAKRKEIPVQACKDDA